MDAVECSDKILMPQTMLRVKDLDRGLAYFPCHITLPWPYTVIRTDLPDLHSKSKASDVQPPVVLPLPQSAPDNQKAHVAER